ncbi:MAG: polysaccharide deacetylase family protein [Lachnoclostridium sp.]|jgi:peptidoglycan/xylan/chitin deacetylase (PgdA/CDA1 family)|nr:polysaccharide deacetylase family protein [Lachnoclostridium sp.]
MKRNTDNRVTIVMYHYVRDLANSKYPEIKGLDLKIFYKHLDFIEKHFNVVTTEDVQAAVKSRKGGLPPNAVLLTFDDGYKDHYTNVFPALKERGWQGSFFVPSKVLKDRVVLDVNKVHFILASTPAEGLVREIFDLLDQYRKNGEDILPNQELYHNLAVPKRWDENETVFVKRILQQGVDERIRAEIADILFSKHVAIPEREFSEELYVNWEQIKEMKRNNMFFGLHGHGHYWLGKLLKEQVEEDIDRSLQYFGEIVDVDNWTMNYPYGSYNDDVIQVVKERGCKIALAVENRTCLTEDDNAYALPRIDANDLMKSAAAKMV